MAVWVALLRGINVGGRNLLPMKELVGLLEAQGLRHVRTYIQSGNLVFESGAGSSGSLAARILDAIERHAAFRPRIVVLRAKDLHAVASRNPFPQAVAMPKALHLFFLANVPKAANRDALSRLRSGREDFALEGSVLYLHTPDGFAGSKLPAALERHLGVDATARNWSTVMKLLEMTREG